MENKKYVLDEEYARPQVAREAWDNLNGLWNFSLIEIITKVRSKNGIKKKNLIKKLMYLMFTKFRLSRYS